MAAASLPPGNPSHDFWRATVTAATYTLKLIKIKMGVDMDMEMEVEVGPSELKSWVIHMETTQPQMMGKLVAGRKKEPWR